MPIYDVKMKARVIAHSTAIVSADNIGEATLIAVQNATDTKRVWDIDQDGTVELLPHKFEITETDVHGNPVIHPERSLTVLVKDKNFIWDSPEGTKKARRLWGAQHSGHLKVYRGDIQVDQAIIGSIGTHGAYDGFDGLATITRSQYQHFIMAKQFQEGDRLEIEFTHSLGAREYWAEMVWVGGDQVDDMENH